MDFEEKLGRRDRHVSGHRWQGFQGQRSTVKVKVIARPTKCMFLLQRKLLFLRCYVETAMYWWVKITSTVVWKGIQCGNKCEN